MSLADFAGQRVIVYFYPAAMTPGCTTQAVDFTAAMAELQRGGPPRDRSVTGHSGKTHPVPQTSSRCHFPLLSDVDKKTLAAYGAYGEKLLYGKLIEGVIRSTFVIDVDAKGRGTVAVAQYNVKATGHVDKLQARPEV